MGKHERELLEHLAKAPSEPPKGLGTMTLGKLLERGYASKHPYAGEGPRLYAITEAGRLALAVAS